MSDYNKISGSYRLPAGIGNKIRQALIADAIKRKDDTFAKAMAIYKAVRAIKGSPTPEEIAAVVVPIQRKFNIADDDIWDILILLTRDVKGKPPATIEFDYSQVVRSGAIGHLKTFKVNKSDVFAPQKMTMCYPKLGDKNLSCYSNLSTYRHGNSTLSFVFSGDYRTVTVRCDRNNREVERCEEESSYALFFRELDKVKWTRGTGGYLTHTSEYDDDDDGGFGERGTMVHCYGPIAEAEADARNSGIRAFIRSRRRSSSLRR